MCILLLCVPVIMSSVNGQAFFYIFLYLPVYFLFTLIQRLYWRCTGLYDIIGQIESGQLYERSAHIYNIQYKIKKEAFHLINLKNFIATHYRLEHPRYVLRDNVTLISVTADYALFVETPSSYDVYDVKASPFIHLGQFSNAYRIIVLPTSSLIRLGQDIGDPTSRVIWLHSTGRCGSTALSHVFGAIPTCTTISEPMCTFTIKVDANKRYGLSDYKKYLESEEYKELMRATVRLMCKRNQHNSEYLFIKNFTLCGTNEVPVLKEIFPDHTHMFLYRDVLPTVESYYKSLNQHFVMKVVLKMRELAVLRCIINTPPLLMKLMAHPELVERHAWLKPVHRGMTAVGLLVLQWAFYCEHYKMLLQQGDPIKSVKYEYLVSHPKESVAAMLNYCGIEDKHVVPAAAALSEDSQKGTVLSRDNLSQAAKLVITEEVRNECDIYLKGMDLPPLGTPCDLPSLLFASVVEPSHLDVRITMPDITATSA